MSSTLDERLRALAEKTGSASSAARILDARREGVLARLTDELGLGSPARAARRTLAEVPDNQIEMHLNSWSNKFPSMFTPREQARKSLKELRKMSAKDKLAEANGENVANLPGKIAR